MKIFTNEKPDYTFYDTSAGQIPIHTLASLYDTDFSKDSDYYKDRFF